MGSKKVILVRVRMKLGVMAINGYCIFLISSDLKLYHEIQFNIIQRKDLFGCGESYSSAWVSQRVFELHHQSDIYWV